MPKRQVRKTKSWGCQSSHSPLRLIWLALFPVQLSPITYLWPPAYLSVVSEAKQGVGVVSGAASAPAAAMTQHPLPASALTACDKSIEQAEPIQKTASRYTR